MDAFDPQLGALDLGGRRQVLGGGPDGALLLDFNFAYHPSCFYNPRWSCPLAPPANVAALPIEAGEQASAS